jgi:hypothetical protein
VVELTETDMRLTLCVLRQTLHLKGVVLVEAQRLTHSCEPLLGL